MTPSSQTAIVFGQLHVACLIPSLLARHPGLRVEMTFTDRFLDLAASGFDAAVRIGAWKPAENSRYESLRKIAELVCASPDYLARERAPQSQTDLARHRTLLFTPSLGGTMWPLNGPGRRVDVGVDPILAADNIEAMRQAAIAGVGIVTLATFLAAGDLHAGRLVPVFDDYHPAESTISVIYRNAPFLPRRVACSSTCWFCRCPTLGGFRPKGMKADDASVACYPRRTDHVLRNFGSHDRPEASWRLLVRRLCC